MRDPKPHPTNPPASARALALFAAIACVAALPGAVRSQTPPPGFLVENVFPNETFFLPVQIVFMPDGRMLVVEKEGVIWTVTAAGVKLPTPFIDLNAKVLSNDDRGLLGVALDPDFASNRWVYLLYTADPDSNGIDDNIPAFGRLERYRTSLANPDVADLATRQILIGGGFATGIPQPGRNRHHMVGTLRFAPDKTLMIGSGDAANADQVDAGGTDPSFGPGLIDPSEDLGSFRSLTLNSMDGKILRVDKETGLGLPSNPFWDGDGASSRSRVWLYGLRNPFRFAFRPGTGGTDPSLGQPGTLYIGDVGWNTTEECDIARVGGLNFGWPCYEGGYAHDGYQNITSTAYPNPNVLCSAPPSSENPAPATAPAFWWDHGNGAFSNPPGWVGNSATGGVFYTGTSYPASFQGRYFLADFGAGWIKALEMDANDNLVSQQDFVTGAGGVVDIEADPSTGDLYYIDVITSTIHRVRYVASGFPPVVVASVTPTSGFAPLTVTATASASSDPDGDSLSFAWSFGDGSTSNQPDTTYTYTTEGTYTASVLVSDGNGGTGLRSFPIVVGQTPPPGSILQPLDGSFFAQGQPIALEASPVDTTAMPATYRWDVDFGHNTHIHPSVEVRFGRTATFSPATPNDGEQYHFRVRLTVTQGALTAVDTVYVYPQVNLKAARVAFTPAAPGPNAPFLVSATIRSDGEVGAPEVTLQVLEGATVLAAVPVASILEGDSLEVEAAVGPLPLGDHVLRVVVDAGQTLTETDETDNERAAAVTVSGLVAAYSMDEGAGSTLADASGNALTGVLVGAEWTAGRYGGGLSFGGGGQYVDLGDPALLEGTGSMTWSAWAMPETNPSDDGIILGMSNDVTGWQLKSTPDTGPRTFGVAVSGGAGPHAQRYGTVVPQLGAWYHVAGVYDAAARTLDLYVNGVLDNGTLLGVVPSSRSVPALPASIGRRSGGFHFGGVIDEVRIYNRALTPAEIQTDMNTPLSSGSVGVPGAGSAAAPARFSLRGGSPNPFRARTTIRYSIPRTGPVRLQVFSVSGQLLATLEDGIRAAGHHQVTFEPHRLASGVYVCRLEAGGLTAARKLLLLR